VVDFPAEAEAALSGLEVWIIDALRITPHPTHAHLEKTLAWIARLAPKRAILTNMHIDLDYRALLDSLPDGVEPAYDGLRFEVGID
jgi:phosphoribosyl 1,2-cyclic phosphate phosphodiesterase